MVSNNKVVVSGWMEACVVVSVVGKRCSMIERILNCVIARHRRSLTRAKWEEGKKVLD